MRRVLAFAVVLSAAGVVTGCTRRTPRATAVRTPTATAVSQTTSLSTTKSSAYAAPSIAVDSGEATAAAVAAARDAVDVTTSRDVVGSFGRALAEQVNSLSRVPTGAAGSLAVPIKDLTLNVAHESDAWVTGSRKMLDHDILARVTIINGVRTEPGEFDDCVALGSNTEFKCSGTLVAKNVVVSAGHCRLLTRALFGPSISEPGQRIVAVRGTPVVHATYDIAVVILAEDVAVPPRAIASSTLLASSRFIQLVGFGTTTPEGAGFGGVRMKVAVPIEAMDCGLAEQAKYNCSLGGELVAGHPLAEAAGAGACFGDSGGPGYVLDPATAKWRLAGAARGPVSKADGSGQVPCGQGSLYVRVDKVDSWIRSVPGGHWK